MIPMVLSLHNITFIDSDVKSRPLYELMHKQAPYVQLIKGNNSEKQYCNITKYSTAFTLYVFFIMQINNTENIIIIIG